MVRRFGKIPRTLSILFFIVDSRLRYFAAMILTESLACLFIALIVWNLFNFLTTKKYLWIGLLGIFSGMAILNRSIFILFLPMLMLMVYLGSQNEIIRFWNKTAIYKTGFFTLISILVIFPWMFSNCIVLGNFSPLGTQGGINLSGGYSNKAVENKGVWVSPGEMGLFDTLLASMDGLNRRRPRRFTANVQLLSGSNKIIPNSHTFLL